MTPFKRGGEVARAPRDAEEANAYLAQIGALQRDLVLIQAALNEAHAADKARAEAEAAPLVAQAERLTRGVQIWAEANRESLTGGGRSKTVQLAAGEIAWRSRPPSVRIRDVAGVLVALATAGLHRFVRVKQEIDKEAMLREPALASAVPGVSIGSAGEEFVVTPHEVTLAAASGAGAAQAEGRAA
jgi:phage host-nuclease inhibitor protein Gam